MSWDPITRIVGSLGIYTKIDFQKKIVAECHATSSIFRGYSIFMKGKDPRDAHFITSRICGICGDNHCVCSVYAQNMAFGVRPPAMGEWIMNLGEAAEYMFDHNIFQENLVGVDYCEKMVRETNPSVWEKAKKTEAPNAGIHGYKTIADIMTSLNPFTRRLLPASAADQPLYARDVLPDGRASRPSVDALRGRYRNGRDAAALHRLLFAPDALHRVHEGLRAAARRSLQLLVRCAAGLRAQRRTAHSARMLGRFPRSRSLRFPVQEHDATGAARCSSRRASSSTANS